MLSEDGMIEDDNSKHVSSTFRGVYKRKYDTKWRAEITAGTNLDAKSCCTRLFQDQPCLRNRLRYGNQND